MDKHHGQGGSYTYKDGKRELVKGSVTERHQDGDTARDADGKRLDAVDPNAKPEPAIEEPGKAPWETTPAPAKPAASAADKTTKGGQ